jgi:hypothetical protein
MLSLSIPISLRCVKVLEAFVTDGFKIFQVLRQNSLFQITTVSKNEKIKSNKKLSWSEISYITFYVVEKESQT